MKKHLNYTKKKLIYHRCQNEIQPIDYYLSPHIDEKFVEREKKIILEQSKNEKNNLNILEKIVNGKLNKVISENTLMEQKWVLDPDLSVKSAIENYIKDKNIKFEINKFLRIKVGEGIILSKTDFKEEVQNLAK